MNITALVGALMITIAVLIVGYALHQQNEAHVAESQRWLEVCKKEQQTRLDANIKVLEERDTSKEMLARAQRTIENYEPDYLYSICYKEWHAGE
jgi:hypothetical protein